MLNFKKWLEQLQEPFPATNITRNPYINGKYSTSAFPTGKAKVDRTGKDTSLKKKNDKEDGFHL